MIKRWLVVLMLARLSVPQKVEKARFIVKSMTGNTHFSSPVPTLAEVAAAADELETAYLASRDAGKDETVAMHTKEEVLDNLLIRLGHYIEDTANMDEENAEEIILSAGVATKNVPMHTAREFRVKNTNMPGEVVARTKRVPRASYIWQYSTTPTDAASWVTAAITVKATVKISGLTSGKKYSFRVAVVTKDGQGPWSNEIDLVVL